MYIWFIDFKKFNFEYFTTESLDDLENLVVGMFSNVENKNVEAPKLTEHPFNEEHFATKWSVVPIKDIRYLNITFPIPDMHEDFRSGVRKIKNKIL